MKRILLLLPPLLVVYLLVWPVDIDPRAWTPPPAPSTATGPYARNDRLRAVQRLYDGAIAGPEAIAVDAAGRLYTGLEDGRVVSLAADGSACRVLGNTGGRPLGLHVEEGGALLIADAIKGLLRLSSEGAIEVLADRVEGFGLGFTDDLDVDASGRVYFSDASWKFRYGQHIDDALEHGRRGRLLMYDPAERAAGTLLAELSFANGVALGPNDRYVLVSQTTEYKITRYWLKGEKAGSAETFIDNLPGFPDNVTFNGRDRFWVALFAPRDAMLDALLPHPYLRKVVARVPSFMHPRPRHLSFILGLDLDGRPVEQYQYDGDDAFGPIASVREHNGVLNLGSLSDNAIGRVALDALRGAGPVSEPPQPLSGTCAPQS